jgi:hypothetical protein
MHVHWFGSLEPGKSSDYLTKTQHVGSIRRTAIDRMDVTGSVGWQTLTKPGVQVTHGKYADCVWRDCGRLLYDMSL